MAPLEINHSARLTGTQRRILDHLGTPTYIGQVIDRLGTNPMVILKAVCALVKLGLIVRTASLGYEYVSVEAR
ncbi:MarR family transcriptional regulator [Acidipila sp. EB88]|uniref:MarR family transcriptional regulator n=1 Tax=Acidipila sp. EB88 TaxID=2305226 RepID=UPI000F5F4CED|nr:MarR family transcriptional regulator [Acidipila sp. EB88]RRA48468.1 MarR family transcriptional regulator [Acidipila sp. EB88]